MTLAIKDIQEALENLPEVIMNSFLLPIIEHSNISFSTVNELKQYMPTPYGSVSHLLELNWKLENLSPHSISRRLFTPCMKDLRDHVNMATVNEYKNKIQQSQPIFPIIIEYRESKYILHDGVHRLRALGDLNMLDAKFLVGRS